MFGNGTCCADDVPHSIQRAKEGEIECSEEGETKWQ